MYSPGQPRWLCLLLFCGVVYSGFAADVVFQNGQVARGVKVAAETEAQVTIMMPEGLVSFPRKAIKTIDGRLANEPLPVQRSRAQS